MKLPPGWRREYSTKWSKALPDRYPWTMVSVYKNAHDNVTWCATIDFGATVPLQFTIENQWLIMDRPTATECFKAANEKLAEIRKKFDRLKKQEKP